MSSTNFGSKLIFASCVVDTCNILHYVGEFFKWEGSTRGRSYFLFFLIIILRRMGKNKALAHHTYFRPRIFIHTRRVSI